MATINLNPESTVSNNWNYGLASSAHAALSDSSNATFITTQYQNRNCTVELNGLPTGATAVTSVRHCISGFCFNTRSGNTDVQVKLQSSAGTDLWSENHTLNFNSYNPEDHYGTARTTESSTSVAAWTLSDIEGLRLNINTSPEDPPLISQARIVKAFVEVTYTTGYGNYVTNISNIAKVNGVATGDIEKVSGI